MKRSPFTYPVLEYRVIDGDSVHVTLDQGFDQTKSVSVRIHGIDAPEVRILRQRKAGHVAKQFAEKWLAQFAPDERELMVESIERDKYAGRVVGDFFVPPCEGPAPQGATPGMTLGKYLLLTSVARPYDGGKRGTWTDEELEAIAALMPPEPEVDA